MDYPTAFLEDDEWERYHYLNASEEERIAIDNVSGNDDVLKAVGAAAVVAAAKGVTEVVQDPGLVDFVVDIARDAILALLF